MARLKRDSVFGGDCTRDFQLEGPPKRFTRSVGPYKRQEGINLVSKTLDMIHQKFIHCGKNKKCTSNYWEITWSTDEIAAAQLPGAVQHQDGSGVDTSR